MYGFDVADGFNLSTQLTVYITERIVGADSSGSFTVDKPAGYNIHVSAIPLDGDGNMRHFGHQVSFNATNNTVSYSPATDKLTNHHNLVAKAFPARSRSLILVMAYIP